MHFRWNKRRSGKIVFFSVFFLAFFIGACFFPRYLISRAIYKETGLKAHFESFKIEKRLLRINQISSKNENWEINIPSALLAFSFDFKKLMVHTKATLFSPKIWVKKSANIHTLNSFLAKKNTLKIDVGAENGVIFWDEMKIDFDLTQQKDNVLTCNLRFEEGKKIEIALSLEPKRIKADVELVKLDLKKIYPILRDLLPSSLRDLEGDLSGKFSLALDSFKLFDLDLKFSQLLIRDKSLDKVLFAEDLKLKGRVAIENLRSDNFFKNVNLLASFEGGCLSEGARETLLVNDLKGDLILNPMGLRGSLTGNFVQEQSLIAVSFDSDLKSVNVDLGLHDLKKDSSLIVKFTKSQRTSLLDLKAVNVNLSFLEIMKGFLKYEALKKITFNGGALSCRLCFKQTDEKIETLKILNCKIEDFKGSFAKGSFVKGSFQKGFFGRGFFANEYDFFLKNLEGSLDIDLCEGSEKINLDCSLSESSCSFWKKEVPIQNIKLFLKMKDNVFSPSFMMAEMGALKSNFKINGTLSDLFINGEIKGSTKELFNHQIEDEIDCLFSLRKREKLLDLSLIGQMLNCANGSKENLVVRVNWKDFENLDWKKNLQSGWLRMEGINLEKFGFLLSDCKIKGVADINASLQDSSLCMEIQGENLLFEDEIERIFIDRIGLLENGGGSANCLYDLKSEKWDIKIPDLEGTYFLKKNGLEFACKKVKIELDGPLLEMTLPEVQCQNLDLKGKLFLDFSTEDVKLDIITDEAFGKIEDLKELVERFEIKTFGEKNIGGTFTSGRRGFFFSKILKESAPEVIWGINILAKDLSFTLGEDIFARMDLSLIFDSTKGFLKGDLLGSLKLGEDLYEIYCPEFLKEEEKLRYDLRVSDHTHDLGRIKGKGIFSFDEIDLQLDQESHFFDNSLNFPKIRLKSDLSLSSLVGNFSFNTENVCSFLALSKKFKIINGLKGKIDTSLMYEKREGLTLALRSNDLYFNNHRIDNFLINGHQEGDAFNISEINFDDYKSSLVLKKMDKGMKIESVSLTRKGSCIKGEGSFFKESKRVDLNLNELKIEDLQLSELSLSKMFDLKINLEGKGWLTLLFSDSFQIETDLDLGFFKVFNDVLSFENNGPLNFAFSRQEWHIGGVDMMLNKYADGSTLRVNFKDVSYDPGQKKYYFNDGRVFLSLALLQKVPHFFLSQSWLRFDKDPEFSLNIEYFPEEKSFKTYTQDALFFINNEKRELRDLVFLIKENKIFCNFLYLLEDKYHPVSNKIEFGSKLKGELILGENEEPLTIYWEEDKKNINIERAHGSYSGVELEFYKTKEEEKSYTLFGRAKVNFEDAGSLFSKKIREDLHLLNLKDGYGFKGEISLLKKEPKIEKARGDLIGKDFEIMGYQVKTLFAHVEMDDNGILIENLKISDRGGILDAKEISFSKSDNAWSFSLPSLHLFDFCPSILKKINSSSEEIKPFKIKEFSLENLQGTIGDLKTFTGTGYFSFINSFKRDFTLIEVPADVLGRIMGLDLELLVPVTGEVFFEIKDEKFLISKVRDVYSENKRSKFFLVGTPYMDFNGNLDIDIKMKQYVLLKITEKFILSVKGNVRDPQINLEKRKLVLKH